MTPTTIVTVILVVVGALIGGSPATSDQMNFCTSSSQCASDECCVLGMQRYSIPTCTKLRSLNEQCRPNNFPVSTTAYYPDNRTLELTNVYYSLCGCSPELTCNRKFGRCQ